MFLESKGYVFESETDTECIAKLVKHIRSQNPSYTFRQLVEQTISQVRVLRSRLCLFLTYFLLLSSRVPLPVSSSRSSTLENVWQPGMSRRSSTSSQCILQTWISTSGRNQGRRVRKRLDPSPVQPGGPSQDVRSHPSRPGSHQFPSYSKEEDQCYVQSGLRPRMYLVFSFQITSVSPGYKTH